MKKIDYKKISYILDGHKISCQMPVSYIYPSTVDMASIDLKQFFKANNALIGIKICDIQEKASWETYYNQGSIKGLMDKYKYIPSLIQSDLQNSTTDQLHKKNICDSFYNKLALTCELHKQMEEYLKTYSFFSTKNYQNKVIKTDVAQKYITESIENVNDTLEFYRNHDTILSPIFKDYENKPYLNVQNDLENLLEKNIVVQDEIIELGKLASQLDGDFVIV